MQQAVSSDNSQRGGPWKNFLRQKHKLCVNWHVQDRKVLGGEMRNVTDSKKSGMCWWGLGLICACSLTKPAVKEKEILHATKSAQIVSAAIGCFLAIWPWPLKKKKRVRQILLLWLSECLWKQNQFEEQRRSVTFVRRHKVDNCNIWRNSPHGFCVQGEK